MDARQFIRQFGLAILVDLWVAAAAFVTFMVLVEGPEAYESFTVPNRWWAAYFVLMPAAIAYLLCRRARRWAGPPANHARIARLIFAEMPLMVTAYVAGGAVVVVWGAAIDAALLSPGLLATVGGAALAVVVYCGIPLFLRLQTIAGRYLGPDLPPRVLIPAVATVFVLALGVAFVASSSFLVYETVVKGSLDANSVLIWLMLMAYAGVLCTLAYQNYAQSIRPIQDVMAHLASPPRADVSPVVARSLDEIGAMAVQMNRLLVQQADAQRARRANQARLTMFAESAGDYFFELDANLRFTFLSDRFESFSGVPRDEVLGRTMTELSARLGAEDPAEHEGELAKRRAYRNFRVSSRRADGTELHLQMNAIPRWGADGAFLGYLGSGTNVTAIVEAQQTLRIRETELAQAQKMEAVGQLTGGIAHDFNNLLTVVLGNLELLEVVTESDPELKPYVRAAIAAAKRGGALTQRLLAFSRRQALNPDSLDMLALLDDVTEMLRRTLGEDVAVSVHAEPRLWPAFVDRHQLESAIVNLALNARDAMPQGGELRFGLSNHTTATEPRQHFARMRVTDTGHGMGEDVLPHVFEPFFTTKGPGEGSGLGLSMVQGFVKQSGGDVFIESGPGRGTTVTLDLPRADCAPSPSGVRSAAVGGLPASERTILVIEDDLGVGAVVTEALGDLGYQVEIAADGEEALSRLEALQRLDLLLCDIVLPGPRSGIEVAAAIRARRPGCKVIYMSGYALDEIRRRAGVGPDLDILMKPFQLTELAERVVRALDAA